MITNVVSATIFAILTTNWTTTAIEKPYPSPAIPPHGFVVITEIMHQTGAIQSNTVVQVPFDGGTNQFILRTNSIPGIPTQTTNRTRAVSDPSQF
ncbi:MAG: hypothetical protein WCS42_27505 [Verrucomicrobiota bacterium]